MSHVNVVFSDPSGDFDGLTDYYVFIDTTAFKDAANNYFAGISDPAVWSFTTEIGVLLTDPFNYGDTGGDLATISGTWSEVVVGSSSKVQYDNATTLSRTYYSSGSFGSATAQNDTNGGGMEQGFTVGSVTNDGAIYFGFIVKRLDTTDNTDEGPGVLFYNGTTALGGIKFRGNSNPANKYDILLDDGSSSPVLNNNTDDAVPVVIIIRYDFASDTLDGWFNPDVSLAEPAPGATIDLSSSPWGNIDNVAINQNWDSTVLSNTYVIDEIKVTKSWGLLAE